MDVEAAAEICKTDPNCESLEKEFTITFTKDDERAYISSSIASQVKRALLHSDIHVDRLSVYNENTGSYRTTTVGELEASEGDQIVAFNGTVPIESLKIQSKPRSARGYAQIISPQTEVNFD